MKSPCPPRFFQDGRQNFHTTMAAFEIIRKKSEEILSFPAAVFADKIYRKNIIMLVPQSLYNMKNFFVQEKKINRFFRSPYFCRIFYMFFKFIKIIDIVYVDYIHLLFSLKFLTSCQMKVLGNIA